jgi:hypothetical protein
MNTLVAGVQRFRRSNSLQETNLRRNDLKQLGLLWVGTLVLASATLHAQEVSRFSFDVGGGFTTPLDTIGGNTDVGWGLKAGAGVNFNSHLSLMANVGYDALGINSTSLANIGANGGNINIFSARLDPVLHVGTYHHADFYVTGGGGLYREERTFTSYNSTAITITDPFFGAAPAPLTPSSALNYSVNKPGFDAGMGVAFGSKWHGKFFAETRFNRMFLNGGHVDYLPVTFGFRW